MLGQCPIYLYNLIYHEFPGIKGELQAVIDA